jgi:hypothetical protein
VRDQFPDCGDRALLHVANGFDNALWRLGDDLVVRLHRRQEGVSLLHNEVRWLPEESIELFLESYADHDVDLVTRALGRAVLFGLFFLEIGLGARPTYRAVGLATLRRALESPYSP